MQTRTATRTAQNCPLNERLYLFFTRDRPRRPTQAGMPLRTLNERRRITTGWLVREKTHPSTNGCPDIGRRTWQHGQQTRASRQRRVLAGRPSNRRLRERYHQRPECHESPLLPAHLRNQAGRGRRQCACDQAADGTLKYHGQPALWAQADGIGGEGDGCYGGGNPEGGYISRPCTNRGHGLATT